MFSNWHQMLLSMLPGQCRVCHAWPAQTICESCINQFAQPQSRCRTCALPLPDSVKVCGACLKTPPALDACLAAVSYAFPWSGLIVDFKFHQQPALASTFARLLRATPWVEPALDAADIVVPMPLSNERLQSRGFNQALLLARQLARDKTDHRLLLRIRDTPAQSSLKRSDRLTLLKHAFAVDPLRVGQIKGARLVLVDDVMTTGASLTTAAKVLRAAGASHITALVIARTE